MDITSIKHFLKLNLYTVILNWHFKIRMYFLYTLAKKPVLRNHFKKTQTDIFSLEVPT